MIQKLQVYILKDTKNEENGINDANGVNDANDVNDANGVNDATGVNDANDVNDENKNKKNGCKLYLSSKCDSENKYFLM
ncbi:hypothetical protein PMLGA01_110040100 [Plasmodium malariae]|uniref:Uncharacterized protein n=1 Tax=Plasmodium malariae TaxID=5858 RepID=A0A1C3KZZ3_PLAMA|nr:hypothetical protein PMLGA01_110040100 [Plasmodium malariae]